MITVTDTEMIKAMAMAAERMKLILEAAAGASLAAALKLGRETALEPEGLTRVGVVLCGGNMDVSNIPWINMKN